MFHSLFIVSIFDMIAHHLLMFGITLQRRKFPANVRVHTANDVFLSFLRFQHFCCAKSKKCLVIAHMLQPSALPVRNSIP